MYIVYRIKEKIYRRQSGRFRHTQRATKTYRHRLDPSSHPHHAHESSTRPANLQSFFAFLLPIAERFS